MLVARVPVNVEHVGGLKRVVVALEFELHFDRWKFRRGARLGESERVDVRRDLLQLGQDVQCLLALLDAIPQLLREGEDSSW